MQSHTTPNARRAPSVDPHAPRTRSLEHALLEIFVGRWQVRGENAPDAPDGAATPVIGEDTYELLPGGFFVAGRWNHQFGGSTHMGTSLLGVDPETGQYFAHHFDNLGYERRYEVTLRERAWVFTGPFERATMVFGPDGRSFTQSWQISKDGKTWKPLCELKGVRC